MVTVEAGFPLQGERMPPWKSPSPALLYCWGVEDTPSLELSSSFSARVQALSLK